MRFHTRVDTPRLTSVPTTVVATPPSPRLTYADITSAGTSQTAIAAQAQRSGTEVWPINHPSTSFASTQHSLLFGPPCVGTTVTVHRDVRSNTFLCPCGKYSNANITSLWRHAQRAHPNKTKAVSSPRATKLGTLSAPDANEDVEMVRAY